MCCSSHPSTSRPKIMDQAGPACPYLYFRRTSSTDPVFRQIAKTRSKPRLSNPQMRFRQLSWSFGSVCWQFGQRRGLRGAVRPTHMAQIAGVAVLRSGQWRQRGKPAGSGGGAVDIGICSRHASSSVSCLAHVTSRTLSGLANPSTISETALTSTAPRSATNFLAQG